MNATCPDQDTLEAYLLGNLDDAAIEVHLDDCAGCLAKIDELDAVVNRPFAALREREGIDADWQEPAYQALVARAKLLDTATVGDERVLSYDPPKTIGNYALLELICHSMDPVYKAHHQLLKKTVVLKVLPARNRSPESRRRFRREMEAVGRLASPHIVTAFDAGEQDDLDFLAMEFIDGDNLQQVVHQRGPLPIRQALDYVLQAARGLDHAHSAGIIHGDVKPGNLLLDRSGVVKVLDLGLARFEFEEAAHSGGAAGTLAFMAPELFQPARRADERSDIYGLGCTLYSLLTGKTPFASKQGHDLLVAHRDDPIPSLRAVRADCPPALDGLFQHMLAKDPKDRPASMRDVIAELERLQKPARRSIGWRSLIAAGVLLAATAFLAFGVWSTVGDRKKDDTPKKADGKGVAMPKKGATPAIKMVHIKPDEFWMGASDADKRAKDSEKPRTKIKINRAFFLGETEVTQEQYKEVMGTNPSAFRPDGQFKNRVDKLDTSKHPVDSVSWLDAVCFCNKLSERHGLPTYYKIDIPKQLVTIKGGEGYRLPTEAEWEYACRARTETTWYFGENADDLEDHAWFAKNSEDRTHPVGQKKANPWGLYDMYGNVPEWCWDRYDPEYYGFMRLSDPAGSGTAEKRSIRGDGWNSRLPRTTAREGLGGQYGSEKSINIFGFRVARNAE